MADFQPIFFLFFLLVLGFAAVAFALAAKRRKAAEAVAQAQGLTFSAGDPLGVTRLPHPFFRRGDRRRVDITLSGEMGGRQVGLCDYVYTDYTTDDKGNRQSHDHRFAVVVVSLGQPLPQIEIAPEGLGRRFLNAIGVGNDVQFESDEFNRRFTVLSSDRDYAYTLIDARMMAWLLDNAERGSIEIAGNHLCLIAPPRAWEMMPALAQVALGFDQRIPDLAWQRYGGGA